MANSEHQEILKQGTAIWNLWRDEHEDLRVDLTEGDLIGVDLCGVNLVEANLVGASLRGANLAEADLSGARMSVADLTKADLRAARLRGTNLIGAILDKTILIDANLVGADLGGAQLHGADVQGAVFSETVFNNLDLSHVKSLDESIHKGPSSLDFRTLSRSGPLPLKFLRGVGLADNIIEYIPSLFNGNAIQFYSCFISYSSANEDFARRLHADLQDAGVRCWFAPEDMKIGEKIRPAIDTAIRLRDKLLVILSDTSVYSQWVETEVETALAEERNRNNIVLFPIRIDQSVLDTTAVWARQIRETRHIGDFTGWKNHDTYQKAIERLLKDLKAEGKV